jgi:preflagellin peptidase FlaK
VNVGPVAATSTDWLRLLAAPAFVWAAYRDVQVRRVPNDTWVPLTLLALALLVADGAAAFAASDLVWERFVLPATVSVGLLIPLGYAFWYFGGFGGADAKALFVFALLYPTYPAYLFGAVPLVPGTLPAVEPPLPVFSFTVLTNAVLAGIAYPVGVAAANLADGTLDRRMFVARTYATDRLVEAHGRLLGPVGDDPDADGAGGLDLDALRMYLRWRGCTLADLRASPDAHRDPASLPAAPNDPGDGAVGAGTPDAGDGDPVRADGGESEIPDDPWGATSFLDDVDGSAYGTTPEKLRGGLDLIADADAVWVSPGIPFMVPLALGVVSALTVGDLLFLAFGSLGLA